MTTLLHKITDYLGIDSVLLSIGEKWVLLAVALILNLSDIQVIFGIIATIAVIIYTTVKTLNQIEELKERRKKNGTPDNH